MIIQFRAVCTHCVIRALRIPAPTSGRMCHRQRGRIIICPTPCPPKRKCRSSKQSRDSTTITGWPTPPRSRVWTRSEEHTSELQSLMRISYAVFCLKKKKNQQKIHKHEQRTNTKVDKQQKT